MCSFFFSGIIQEPSHVVASSCEKVFFRISVQKECQHICSACNLEHSWRVAVSSVGLVGVVGAAA